MKKKKPTGTLYAKSTEALLGHVNHLYGKLKSTEETDFTNSLGVKLTHKLTLVFLMTIWVGVVSHAKVFMIIFQHPKISRCIVPELEGHFSYEQILNLTVRDQDSEYAHYCYYDQRDYKKYIDTHGYDYQKLMGAILDAPNVHKQPCPHQLVKKIREEFDDIGEVENSHDYLELYCQPDSVKRMMDIAIKYGQFLLSVPIGVIGDFYGRKVAVFFGAGLFTIGIIFTMMPHVAPVIIGRFFIGTSMILFYTIFVIFIESTSAGGRRKVALLLHEGIALGRLTEYLMYISIKNWRYITYINAGMGLSVIILVLFFIHESPRWLYFSGNQKKAYKIIGEDKPDAPSTIRRKRLWPHFKNFTMPVFRKRVMIQMITIWSTSSVTFLIRSKFSRAITNFLLKELLDSGMLMGSCVVLTFVLMSVLGRGRTIWIYFCVTSSLSAMLYFNPRMDKILVDICLCITVTLTENATFFAFYMISEFYPTDFRFTGYGLCVGIHGFGDIFHFHVTSYKIPYKSLAYAPLFLITNISLVSTHFQVETSGPFRLADYPREAMRESDFKEIMKNLMYEQSKSRMAL